MPASTSDKLNKKQASSPEHRELYVIDDYSSMPLLQSRPLFGSFGDWFSAAIRHKLLRKALEPEFLVECGRLVPARHIPKRIQKYFDMISREAISLGFTESFHGTVAALGPYSTATLGMSREDGDVHLFATQIVTRAGQRIQDESFFGYVSWLKDDTSIWTLSTCRLPSPRSSVDRIAIGSDKPNEVLRRHRERIRNKKIQTIAPSAFFGCFEAEHAKQIRDWAGRRLIRLATPAEITRVRNEIEG
jgi:hypothetical protein